MTARGYGSRICGRLSLSILLYCGGAARAEGLREAVAESKQTGRPVLVLGLNPMCPHCEALKKRMSEEPELQKLVAQYVVMRTTSLQDPDAQVLLKSYPPKVAGTPVLIGIAPNGAQLFNQAGAPEGDGLLKMLEEGLASSAKIVSPRRMEAGGPPPRKKRTKKVDDSASKVDQRAEPAKSKIAAKEPPKSNKPTPSADEKAASFLRMARKFSDPEKVKKYAQKAVDAAPESTHAAAARKLIESLN